VSKSKEGQFLKEMTGDVMKVERAEKSEDKARNEEKKEEDFGRLVQGYGSSRPVNKGQIITAKVVQTTKEGILLDIGRKSESFMSWDQFSPAENRTPSVGEVMQVYVVEQDKKGRILLSKKEADFQLDWEKFNRAFKEGRPIVVKVEKVVKGGLLSRLGSLKAFIPASHISLKGKNDLRKFIGKEIAVRVIELEKKSRNIVVSRKFFLLEEREKRKAEVLSDLEEGKVVTGKVSSITKFGVFVDLGGVDGLIHPENLSWGWVKDPHQIVSVGDKINVKVLKLNKEKGKISLGLKQLKPNPWTEVEEKYHVGLQIEGAVTHLTDFGAFVELEEGLEGLIHISDLSWDRSIRHPREVLKKGQRVVVKILDIDAKEKRIALGIKQTESDPWEKVVHKYVIGDVISGRVQEITDFGIFINIMPGIDGFIHVSELDKDYVSHPNKVASVGDEIKAQIVEIDKEKRRIRLSVRQLKEKEHKEKKKEEKKGRKKKEAIAQVSSSEEEGVMIGDFIGEDLKERLRESFK